jgi:hypothetical protein
MASACTRTVKRISDKHVCSSMTPPPDDDDVPDWIKSRRVQNMSNLHFAPVRRSRARPIDHAYIDYALRSHFDHVDVIEAYEICDDVWHVCMLRQGVGWDIFLYEHMGIWECSSITRR